MNGSFSRMLSILAAVAICFASFSIANAQDDQMQQIKLTDAHVKGYIGASKQLAKITKKIEEGGDKPNPKLLSQLDAIAKKHGFKSYNELDIVIANISFVLSGFDDKGKFTDPSIVLKDELAQVKGDRSIKSKEKKKMIAEITEAMKATKPLKHKSNVALVKKHLEKLDAVLQPKQ